MGGSSRLVDRSAGVLVRVFSGACAPSVRGCAVDAADPTIEVMGADGPRACNGQRGPREAARRKPE
eukprot:719337-Alexandrium_andersonii.AAC.1